MFGLKTAEYKTGMPLMWHPGSAFVPVAAASPQTNSATGITGAMERLASTEGTRSLADFLNIRPKDDPVDIYLSCIRCNILVYFYPSES